MDPSITLLFVSKKSKHTLITPSWHWLLNWLLCLVEFDPFSVTVKQNCACWYLSLVSTFCLHQTSSLHLELCFITRLSVIYKQDSLVFQVCLLRYIRVWNGISSNRLVCYYRMIYAVNSQRFQVVLWLSPSQEHCHQFI